MSTSNKGEINAAEVRYNALFFPVAAFGLLVGLWSSPLATKGLQGWKWFDWHPLSMAIAFVVLAPLAALKKRIGGKGPTVIHGSMANLGMMLGCLGYYVIWSNKEMLNKEHLTSLHGKLGAASVASFVVLGIVGALGLHPDFGMLKTNKLVRGIHKYSGRAGILTAWSAAFTGFVKYETRVQVQAPILLGLLALSFFTII